MKLKFFLIAISFLFIQNFLSAQSKKNFNLYGDIGYITLGGRSDGMNGSINYCLKNGWYFSAEGTTIGFEIKNIPPNYAPSDFFPSQSETLDTAFTP